MWFCGSPHVVANLRESENGCRSVDVLWGVCPGALPLSEVLTFAKNLERAATLADIWVDTGMAVTKAEVLERYYPGRYEEEALAVAFLAACEPTDTD